MEDESDYKILSEFARIREHNFIHFIEEPFFVPIYGRDAREAKAHFFGLKAIHPQIKGVLLLDGDNRNLPDREIGVENLIILRWKRYEIETYLLHPNALLRFVEGPEPEKRNLNKREHGEETQFEKMDLFGSARRREGEKYLKENFFPAALKNPLKDSDYLIVTPASKSILPEFLEKAEIKLSRKDYFQIAAQMKPEEIHPEVLEKLDAITNVIIRP